MITDGFPLAELAELAGRWDEIRQEYDDFHNDAYDRAALDCAARLAADPGGPSSPVWTLGLLLMAPYVATGPGEGVVPAVTAALTATDAALRDRPCAHETHPWQEHDAEYDEDLARQVCALADPASVWEEYHPREQWLCPRNVAGFARIALDVIEPGSAGDVPPRLPVGEQDAIDTLSALLHGYPEPGTDVGETIRRQADALRWAAPADRPGRLLAVVAVGRHAASDAVRDTAVLDDLIGALEQVLPHLADATCAHGRHPAPPRWAPDAAALGITLSSPGGRALYARDRGEDPAVEEMLCPVALAQPAGESLTALRARRGRLLGGDGG
ncbi:hypothetical protein [Streptomyces sp. NPDC127190]|uniref:hypothetical protein n=1 Tax=unclassified Streptomyces TaxID=2593676 RepID=UPI003630BF90